MGDMPATNTLPTLDKLGVSPSSLSSFQSDPSAVLAIARAWISSFAQAIASSDAEAILKLMVPESTDDIEPWWRDMLALTWDFRTFRGPSTIRTFLSDRIAQAKVRDVRLDESLVLFEQPYPDLAWIRAHFEFALGDWGNASGIVRLVPLPGAGGGQLEWKALVVYTNLEGLTNHPEKIGELREQLPLHGKWIEKRRKETAFEGREPQVLVIGAGQSGLDIAARLKFLDVPTLVVEKQPRIGDQWRNRYESLCLHDIVWYDHMPYLPFPPNWPVYTPSQKLADWLESYAHNMELDVWTSSEVTKLSLDEQTKKWTAVLKLGDGSERTFVVDHVVFAIGLAAGVPNMPTIPGSDVFEGQILHSTQHRKATDHTGQKVFIVGACTSGHDIAADYYENGVDVTLYQRSSTYIMTTKEGMPRALAGYWGGAVPHDLVDRLGASMPTYMVKDLSVRTVDAIKTADSELLEGLKKRGFRLNFGVDGSGFLFAAYQRGGGYYLDVGASQLIVDGKIKLKNDAKIARLDKKSVVFDDGSEVPADVVLFATGFGDTRVAVEKLVGPEAVKRVKPIWGLNSEGELRGTWREIGLPHLWYIMGNLAMCRFHSLHLALQIKAIQEGIFGTRYSPAA